MSVEATVKVISGRTLPSYPVILCFATGTNLPEACIPMKRDPDPEIGKPFNGHFAQIFGDALKKNPAIHDGAIVFLRSAASSEYALAKWSCRLAPSRSSSAAEPNRGSAYNSAASMALEANVDEVFLITPDQVERFVS